jgi:hypothetical protein
MPKKDPRDFHKTGGTVDSARHPPSHPVNPANNGETTGEKLAAADFPPIFHRISTYKWGRFGG